MEMKTVTNKERNSVNIYAEIRYGKVYELYQSHLPFEEFISIFTPTATFADITGVVDSEGNNIVVGSTFDGKVFGPSDNFNPVSLEDHKKIAQERRNNIVKEHIVEGMNVTHNNVEYHYSLEEVDQDNIKTYFEAVSIDPKFEPTIRVINISTGKSVKLNHNSEMINRVMFSMSNHIQDCKKNSWRIDEDIQNATNIDEVYAALNWEKI